MSTAVHITWHGAQINLGDLPPYLTYAVSFLRQAETATRREEKLLQWGKEIYIRAEEEGAVIKKKMTTKNDLFSLRGEDWNCLYIYR
jgi:hypothetical protein